MPPPSVTAAPQPKSAPAAAQSDKMTDELRKCPHLYTSTPEYMIIWAHISNDVQKLVVAATAADGCCYESQFDEEALKPIKEAWLTNCTWEKFFASLQNLFNRNTAKFAGDVLTLQPENGKLKITFKLNTTKEHVQEGILKSLFDYHHIHQHLRDVEKQVAETVCQENDVRAQAAELEKEEISLKESVTRNKEQVGINVKRLKELQAQLAEAEDEKRKAGGVHDAVEEEDDDAVICRVRIPLGKKECKDYSPELLKLVKSKFITDKDIGEELPFNKIIHPFTQSDLARYTSKLTDKQRLAIWEGLKKIDSWDYSVFNLQTAMAGNDTESLAFQPNGGSLFITAYALFFRYGLMQKFHIDENLFINWLSVVEAGYNPNPYHNSMHAADVLHITHFILSTGGMQKKCNLTDEDVFAALFAAAIHDYDHPGINNSFHIKAQTYLAYLYNDRSILENRHVSSVFELMKLPRFNILACLTEEQRRDIRETIIEMVLATDMGLHGKYVSQFKRRLQENNDFVKKDDIRLALAMAVKMADISNCGRPTDLYLRWSNKIADEFYMQGDRERNLGMPCSPFMDRLQPAMAKGQIAFMNYIVIPMFDCISELVPDMRFSVDLTEVNKNYWTKNDDSVVA